MSTVALKGSPEARTCETAPVAHPVSIQICTLNEEKRLPACLKSVLANEPAEVLVIDGGSSDRTVQIAEAFGCRVLEPGRLGLGASRRLGYQSGTQPYTAFVDADDQLPPAWLSEQLSALKLGGYAALQSQLRSLTPQGFWGRGWNQYFIESVRPCADSTMVGRPALFLTSALQETDAALVSLDEDTHLSRRFQLQGLRQGIGESIAYRECELTWHENWQKWQSYGRGYRQFVVEHPTRRRALLRHMLVTIPLVRGWRPVLRGQVMQPAFAAIMAIGILRGWFDRSGSNETPRVTTE